MSSIEKKMHDAIVQEQNDINFLIKDSEYSESDDEADEYGEEVYQKLYSDVHVVLKDMREHTATKYMTDTGTNDFIQAIL